jgi:manganese oxidase
MSLLQPGPIVLAVVALLAGGFAPRHQPPAAAPLEARTARLPAVAINDNRRPAGTLANGRLTLALRANAGLWRPEGGAGPALTVEAFGEGASPLSAPAPLIRVPEGTEIAASVRNELAAPMRVHGLCERGAATCAPLDVPAGETRHVRFNTGPPGTYHYWATTTGMPLAFRAVGDTQLSGAFVVDPAGTDPENERIFVITDWTSLTLDQLKQVASATDPGVAFLALNPRFTFLMNGLSWPHTERLTYRRAEKVRWRVLNLSTQAHTMHLHGFYFEVDSLGDGLRDQRFASGDKARGRDPAHAGWGHHGDDLDAGACRQLAVPLPHQGARLSRAAPWSVARFAWRPSCRA